MPQRGLYGSAIRESDRLRPVTCNHGGVIVDFHVKMPELSIELDTCIKCSFKAVLIKSLNYELATTTKMAPFCEYVLRNGVCIRSVVCSKMSLLPIASRT